jgi:hypothetical protein
MFNPENVKRRVAARGVVRDMLDLIPDMIRGKRITREVFLEVLVEEVAPLVGKIPVEDNPSLAMSESQAIEFEKTLVPYGVHKGKRVGEVNPDHFIRLLEGEFHRNLLRYMRSKRFQDRQGG